MKNPIDKLPRGWQPIAYLLSVFILGSAFIGGIVYLANL